MERLSIPTFGRWRCNKTVMQDIASLNLSVAVRIGPASSAADLPTRISTARLPPLSQRGIDEKRTVSVDAFAEELAARIAAKR